MTPSRLREMFNTVVETITMALVLSIPVAVIILIVCNYIAIDSVSVHTVVDFVNDAS